MRLSPAQNQIMYALQKGWELFCSSDSKWVTCGTDKHQFVFHSSIFYRLLDKGFIRQRNGHPHDYYITEQGKNVKTKAIDLTHHSI